MSDAPGDADERTTKPGASDDAGLKTAASGRAPLGAAGASSARDHAAPDRPRAESTEDRWRRLLKEDEPESSPAATRGKQDATSDSERPRPASRLAKDATSDSEQPRPASPLAKEAATDSAKPRPASGLAKDAITDSEQPRPAKAKARDPESSAAADRSQRRREREEERAREQARQEAISRVLRRSSSDAGGRDPLDDLPDSARPTSRWRRRLVYLALVALVAAVWWGFSVRNHGRLYLVCFPDRVEPQQGNRMPWGRSPMKGAPYAAIAIPPEADCTTQELASREALDAALCDLLIRRIEATVERADPDLRALATKVTQAQLLTRGRPEQRKRLARLAADVAYRQGRQQVKVGEAALREAVRHFHDAQRRGTAVGRDTNLWLEHLERTLRTLRDPRTALAPPAAAPPATQPASRPTTQPLPLAPPAKIPPPEGGVLL